MARAHLADSDYSVMADFASGTFANIKTKFNEHDAALDALEAGTSEASLTGANVAVLAQNAVIGGIEVCHTFDIPDAADADYDIVLTAKTEIFGVVCIKDAAGAGNTVTVKNGATAITDVMATAVDKTVTRAATIDKAQRIIAAGGTLRCSVHRAAGSGAVQVFVTGVRRA